LEHLELVALDDKHELSVAQDEEYKQEKEEKEKNEAEEKDEQCCHQSHTFKTADHALQCVVLLSNLVSKWVNERS
jgi:hypothetical protein